MTTVEEIAVELAIKTTNCNYEQRLDVIKNTLAEFETKVREETVVLVLERLFGKKNAESDEGKTIAEQIFNELAKLNQLKGE